MGVCSFILAAAPSLENEAREAVHKPVLNTRDTLLIIGVSLILGLVFFFWAYFKFRRKPGIEFGPGQSDHKIPFRSDSESSSSGRRRKRHRRREHRPRNPTLHETGGLPPPRPDGELPKY